MPFFITVTFTWNIISLSHPHTVTSQSHTTNVCLDQLLLLRVLLINNPFPSLERLISAPLSSDNMR